jgi:dTMP kinase
LILLSRKIETGLRCITNGDEWNRLDAYTMEFHQRVRKGYLELVKAEPERWVVVNAEQSWDDVQENLRGKIIEGLERKA